MTIRIARDVLDEIHAHAEAMYPEECCGLLTAGDANAASGAPQPWKTITGSMRMKNAYEGPKRHRYSIDPLELFRADRAMAEKGHAITGIYHSHPDSPASLSDFDLQHSFPWYSYVVVSVPKGRAGETKSWTLLEDRKSVISEEMEILD